MPLAYDPSRIALYTPEAQETLFRAGVTYNPTQIAVEAARLAYVRFEESPHQHSRLEGALALVGFGSPRHFLDVLTDTQAFGAHRPSDNTVLIAFRGTQPDKVVDVMTDLHAFTKAWPESAGRVHEGFADRTRRLLPAVRDWLQGLPANARVILTGHSLGAALATLTASIVRPAMLFTLGSPRVGNADFVGSLSGIDVVRMVDCCDVVTMVPPEVPSYAHTSPLHYIDRAGHVTVQPAEALVDQDRTHARIEYPVQYAWRLGSVLARDLADHAPVNYARAFFT